MMTTMIMTMIMMMMMLPRINLCRCSIGVVVSYLEKCMPNRLRSKDCHCDVSEHYIQSVEIIENETARKYLHAMNQ
jgi:hypothetical protein